MVNERWSVVPVMWDEIASLKIQHIRLCETRLVNLCRVLTYDEDALSGLFDFKLSDRDLIELMKEINKYLSKN